MTDARPGPDRTSPDSPAADALSDAPGAATFPVGEFRAAAARLAEWIASYRDRIARFSVLPRVRPGDVAARIPRTAPEDPEEWDEILADLDDIVLPGLTHWNHPGFLAYFPSSSSAPGVLAEFAAAALNQNAMLWRTSPAATELEERMVGWVRRFVGLPDAFAGVLLDTASTSTFTALLAARARAVPKARERGLAGRPELGGLAVYGSDHTHSSVAKAAIAAGIGLEGVRAVPTDSEYAMRADLLAAEIERDIGGGRIPVMVCATVGTTSCAAADPVQEIARVCAARGVWLHVDAAYAGPAASLPELAHLFRGWERADSIVLNPHKWMMTPIDCSVLLYRDPETVRASLALTPEYLKAEEDARNLMDYGLALGRRFRALKLWFIFRRYGAGGLRRKLRRDIALASEFAAWVAAAPDFELAAPPRFGTVCFRSVPAPGADPDAWNAALLGAVNRRGALFLSHAELGGRTVLRLSIGGMGTDRSVLRAACAALAEERALMAARHARGEEVR